MQTNPGRPAAAAKRGRAPEALLELPRKPFEHAARWPPPGALGAQRHGRLHAPATCMALKVSPLQGTGLGGRTGGGRRRPTLAALCNVLPTPGLSAFAHALYSEPCFYSAWPIGARLVLHSLTRKCNACSARSTCRRSADAQRVQAKNCDTPPPPRAAARRSARVGDPAAAALGGVDAALKVAAAARGVVGERDAARLAEAGLADLVHAAADLAERGAVAGDILCRLCVCLRAVEALEQRRWARLCACSGCSRDSWLYIGASANTQRTQAGAPGPGCPCWRGA